MSKSIPKFQSFLEPLSRGARLAMHSLARQRIERRVRKISKGDLTSVVEKNAIAYLETAAQSSVSVSDELLKKTMQADDAEEALVRVRELVEKQTAEFTRGLILNLGLKSVFAKLFKSESEILQDFRAKPKGLGGKAITALHEKAFGMEQRLFFRLKDESDSFIQNDIADHLQEVMGEGVVLGAESYQSGYINDARGNQRKIGRLIEKPSLRQAFQEDPARAAKDMVVVFSIHPNDIARASFRRRWESCISPFKTAIVEGVGESKEGVIIAYLVKGDDPHIADPLARVMIKPYHLTQSRERKKSHEKGKNSVVFRVFKPIGFYHPGFFKAVVDFVEEKLNANSIVGEYDLPKECEHFRECDSTVHFSKEDPHLNLQILGTNLRTFLTGLGADVMYSHINLKGLGLNKLPNLPPVTVFDNFDCSENNIYSLEGSPETVSGDLVANGTMIVTFEGAPPTVGGKFSYMRTPYLSTLAGIPQASEYVYGNHDDPMENKKSKTPSFRGHNLSLFPRFRKNEWI